MEKQDDLLVHSADIADDPAWASGYWVRAETWTALLEAAKSALAWAEDGGPCDFRLIEDWRDQLRAAVAKAEPVAAPAAVREGP